MKFDNVFIDKADATIIAKATESPGIRPRDIVGITGMSRQSTRYRLLTLERAGLIRTERVRGALKIYAEHTETLFQQ